MTKTFDAAIGTYVEKLAANYRDYSLRGADKMSDDQLDRAITRVMEFKTGIKVITGKKYIKITKERGGVHSFIVAVDGHKYPKGTVLKPAGWSGPTQNFSRGNIFKENYSSNWSGI